MFIVARCGSWITIRSEVANAVQAEQRSAFQAIIGRFVQLPASVLDLDCFVERHVCETDEAIEAELLEAGVADEEVAENGEPTAGRSYPSLDLLRDMPAGLDERAATVFGADYDAHGANTDMRSRA
ncbi:hypothetical protein ACRAVF_27600 [Bradyrhizobium oligotrophicum S58]